MTTIIWGSCLETGNEEIDGQHRTLVDTFNRLCAAVDRKAPRTEELEGILTFLRDFTLVHFQREQELMAQYRYPLEAEHRRLHSDLAGQIEGLLDAFHQGATTLSPVTLDYLDEWLSRHIREEDVRLADFLKQAQAQARGTS